MRHGMSDSRVQPLLESIRHGKGCALALLASMPNIGEMHGRLTQTTLLSLAYEGEESIIAKHFHEIGLSHLNTFPTREERQFAFRCFWVPCELSRFKYYENAFRSPRGQFWYMWAFTSLFAHSRMIKEMLA